MYSYVAFVRSAIEERANAQARELIHRFKQFHQEWELLDQDNGQSVFHSLPLGRSIETITLPSRSGMVLGTLFPRDLEVSPRAWRPVIDERCAAEIVRSHGRYLMDRFWGGYVALLAKPGGAVHYVLRDCSGKVPCYVIAHGAVTIIAANIEDLGCLQLPPFSLNARYLAGFIYNAELAQRECALNEIKELLAGECLELRSSQSRQFALWDPREVCNKNIVENFDDAAHQVRAVTQACVDFWASKYDRIIHQLSGGLDSSVILGCLNTSANPPLITCLHLESDGIGESESAFAKLAADAAGVELVVQPGYSQYSRYDERVFRLPKSAKPSVAHLGIAIEADLRNASPSGKHADAIWDGQGGDHLFFQARATFSAVDYAFLRGVGGAFSTHVRDAARLSRSSYWGTLCESVRLGLFHFDWHPEDEYRREATFLNRQVMPENIVDYVWQPWADDTANLPPGKRLQIGLLANLIHRHRAVTGLLGIEQHHPLFSQPLFELCLQIPIYTLLRGGIDRALERAAFRDCVPEPIIRRQNKGSIASAFMSKIRESLPFIRELILDGVLVRERILERSALEPYLLHNRPLSPRILWPFLSCIAAEIWARKWDATRWRLA
jgi:asparagine synthase (glutamine-hydrolysing)